MRRLRIGRINLRLRHLTPAVAQEAARLLGPALAQALTDRTVIASSASHLDAGRVTVDAPASAPAVAAGIARQIAGRTSRG
jgi:hypothetical protein